MHHRRTGGMVGGEIGMVDNLPRLRAVPPSLLLVSVKQSNVFSRASWDGQ